MANIQYFPFNIEYDDHPRQLISDVAVFNSRQSQKEIMVKALWDTGAVLSAVTPDIVNELNLVSYDKILNDGRIHTNGIGDYSSWLDVVKISMRLSFYVELIDRRVTVVNLVKGVGMLIGMDIIQLGDFSISNGAGRTLFTFVMPPFDDKIDLYAKALNVNRNTKP